MIFFAYTASTSWITSVFTFGNNLKWYIFKTCSRLHLNRAPQPYCCKIFLILNSGWWFRSSFRKPLVILCQHATKSPVSAFQYEYSISLAEEFLSLVWRYLWLKWRIERRIVYYITCIVFIKIIYLSQHVCWGFTCLTFAHTDIMAAMLRELLGVVLFKMAWIRSLLRPGRPQVYIANTGMINRLALCGLQLVWWYFAYVAVINGEIKGSYN